MIKENLLTVTMEFNHRVKAFIQDILKPKSSPLKLKYYHYRQCDQI